ncbi:MAG: type II restriction endonuclease [bacterium]
MQEIIQRAKEKIPSLDSILEEAMRNLEREEIDNRFGEILVYLDKNATEIYRNNERKAIETLAVEWIEQQKEEIKERLKEMLLEEGWENFVKKAGKLFSEFGILVQALEKDLGNMRKARGGKTFEKLVINLLKIIGIECEVPKGSIREKLRRIDIVVPSMDVALKTPDKAFFLACKRTLRERWKQEVPSSQPNQRVYLITIDDELSENKANEIRDRGLIAFVRDDLKEQKHLLEKPWVRRLRDLPRELRGL